MEVVAARYQSQLWRLAVWRDFHRLGLAFIPRNGTALLRPWREVLMREPCVYCGGAPSGLDHIIASTSGGADGWENRAPACVRCDQCKANHGLLIFMVARHRARVRADRRARWRNMAPEIREAAIMASVGMRLKH